jgi:hypothetical protein
MVSLRPPNFIETEGPCSGLNYTLSQPSRESSGVTMSEIQDKYITEFELPYRNVRRYIGEVKNNWNRLDQNQRDSIRQSFKDMGFDNLSTTTNKTSNKSINSCDCSNGSCKCSDGSNCVCSSDGNCKCSDGGSCKCPSTQKNIKENFGTGTTPAPTNPHLSSCIDFFKFASSVSGKAEDIDELLNILLRPTDAQKTQYSITNDDVTKNRDAFYLWSLQNYPTLLCNWQTGILIFFLVLIFLCIGIACGTCIE